jgi:hypothetical protein
MPAALCCAADAWVPQCRKKLRECDNSLDEADDTESRPGLDLSQS